MFKWNSWCLVWIRVKMGKDVGQNLQSKSRSKNRRNWLTQLQKEGPFLKLRFDVCLCERSFSQLLSGRYSLLRTFLLPREGNTPCLIHPVVCLFRANTGPFCIHEIKSPQLFLLSASLMSFNSQLRGGFLHETKPPGICDLTQWAK